MCGRTPTICLLGDVMLGRSVAETLALTAGADVWSPGVREVCADCDVLVVNLECCVSGQGSPTAVIPGKRFFFRAPPGAVDALRAIGASVAGVANNHALDFGADALVDTLGHLRAAGIVPVGAGNEIGSARRGVVVSVGGLLLGVSRIVSIPTNNVPSLCFAKRNATVSEGRMALVGP